MNIKILLKDVIVGIEEPEVETNKLGLKFGEEESKNKVVKPPKL